MPNNSCTIILNGHGFYTSTKVISLGATTINYNIIFPCGLRESISAAHHNLIMGTLAFTNPFTHGLPLIESFNSTTIINRAAPIPFVTDMNDSRGPSKVGVMVKQACTD